MPRPVWWANAVDENGDTVEGGCSEHQTKAAALKSASAYRRCCGVFEAQVIRSTRERRRGPTTDTIVQVFEGLESVKRRTKGEVMETYKAVKEGMRR